MSNVIDFKAKTSKKTNINNGYEALAGDGPAVIDMTEKRQALLKEDRRQVKRTILTEFIAVHAIVPGMGLMKVNLYDITENGLSFDIDEARGQFQVGENISMRIYLNHQTYFPFDVKVRHVTHVKDEGIYRHGGEFEKGSINDVALYHFIKFIETVSAGLKNDRGDILVSRINS